jgi:hypothetical protein
MSDEAIQVSKTHVNFDEMGWPLPDGELEWRLRYGNPTMSDRYMAASILSAYQALICRKTQKQRNRIAMVVKWAAEHNAGKLGGRPKI